MNKRTLGITFVLSFLVISGLTTYHLYSKSQMQKEAERQKIEQLKRELADSSAFGKKLEPIYSMPKKLTITTLGLNLDIIEIGVAEDGSMETPKDWNLAGWFNKSGKPGQSRNLIINGHYDNSSGGPAAFYKLKSVKEGDTVDVLDSYGRIYSYKVIELGYVDIKDPSRLQILENEEGKSTLTLITCGGVWLPSEGTYNKRLVVKGELAL